METGAEEYLPLNEVWTVLSVSAVQDVEDLLYRYNDCFPSENVAVCLMAALAAYIRAHPDPERHPAVDDVIRAVTWVIDLNERLTRLTMGERVGEWTDTGKEWRMKR
jgi:hypothetical protein